MLPRPMNVVFIRRILTLRGTAGEGDSRSFAGWSRSIALRGRAAAVARRGGRAGEGRSRGRELHRRVPADRHVQGGDAVHAGTGGGRCGHGRRPRRVGSATPGPTAVTTPAASCPSVNGVATLYMPVRWYTSM